MNFEIYSEESNIIDYSDYAAILRKIETNTDNRMSIRGRQRKIYFNQDINYLVDVSEKDDINTDRYSINIYDRDLSRLVLDKRSNREGTIYRQYTYISMEQCRRILKGDIQWMCSSEQMLLHDLYLQMTINQNNPGVIVDYSREMFRLGYSGDYIIFDTAINSTYHFDADLLTSGNLLAEDILSMEERLEPDKVVMTYRQGIGMSKVLARVMDMSQSRRQVGN